MNLEIDLGLDSLARAEVFAALEHAFSIQFEGEEAARALTVTDVIDLVGQHAGHVNGSDVSTDLNWGTIVHEADDVPEIEFVLRDRPVFVAFAFSVYRLFNYFCRIFMRLEVHGLENVKRERPFLICPNHQSYLDPFVLCSNYPFALFRNIFHVGASEFFSNSLMRFIAKMLNVVPVNPDTELMRAMKAGAIGLRHGKVLNIYPEGERAFDGELHSFKKGAAILATELDLPIIPVAMDGLYKVWARGSWRIRPAKVKIMIGRPIFPKEVIYAEPQTAASGESLVPADAHAALTDHLKQTITTMIRELRETE
jgi:long-chain acyl-CoA synthetase